MANTIRSFQELACWKLAFEIKKFVREIIKSLPKQEQFDLIDNMRRALRSCTRKIAEEFGLFHFQENIQFCRISRGSMKEIWDDLITCLEEKYISQADYDKGTTLIQHAI